MADSDYAQHIPGEALLFKFGNGADPEQFAASCSINTDRKVEFSADVYQSWRANCVNPSAPAAPARRIKGKDVKFTGSGMTDAASFATLQALYEAAEPFNGQVVQDVEVGGWTIDAPWIIESLSTGGTRGEDQAFEISLAVAGPYALS